MYAPVAKHLAESLLLVWSHNDGAAKVDVQAWVQMVGAVVVLFKQGVAKRNTALLESLC